MAAVVAYGLKSWTMLVSGELSITRVAPVLAAAGVDDFATGLDELDEQAATPAASRPAASTATNLLWVGNLLIFCLSFFSGYMKRQELARFPSPASSRAQHAAALVSDSCSRAGFSWRQRSKTSGHLGLNGQPWVAIVSVAFTRWTRCAPAPSPPVRSVLPRLSGSGAELTSSWVYGCFGCWVISSAGPRSTIWPAYMTRISS